MLIETTIFKVLSSWHSCSKGIHLVYLMNAGSGSGRRHLDQASLLELRGSYSVYIRPCHSITTQPES